MLGNAKGTAHMVGPRNLGLPLSAEDVLSLKTGDIVLLNGPLVTGRDKVHKYLVEKKPQKAEIPFALAGSVLYHCGPVAVKQDGGWRIRSTGYERTFEFVESLADRPSLRVTAGYVAANA